MTACDITFPTPPCTDPVVYGGVVLQKLALQVRRGSTEQIPIRVETNGWIFRDILAGFPEAPFRMNVPGHDLPHVWRVGFMNARSWPSLAASESPPCDHDMHRAVAIDPDTLVLPEVNGSGFKTPRQTPQIAYRQPLELDDFVSAETEVFTEAGQTVETWTTANGRMSIDPVTSSVWLLLSAQDTENLPDECLVFHIELIRGNGEVNRICLTNSPLLVLDKRVGQP